MPINPRPSSKMSEKPAASAVPRPRLSDWDRLAHHRGPNLLRWLLASLTAAGIMLYASPPSHASVLPSVLAVLLSPVILFLGWMAGTSTFSVCCEHYRRLHRTWPYSFVVPVIVAAIVGLGLLGGGCWWLLASALAYLGHRKGTQRAWWAAVAALAFAFRSEPGFGLRPVADNDEQALAKAVEAVTEEIGRKRDK